jgi:hypothetical protein
MKQNCGFEKSIKLHQKKLEVKEKINIEKTALLKNNDCKIEKSKGYS